MSNNDQKRDEGYIEKLVCCPRSQNRCKAAIFTLTALTAVGDGKGVLALAVSHEVPAAIQKGHSCSPQHDPS